ncbi:MAG: PD40 domain-containing protein [Chloroflexi bacterium]|nr:PD40 domain-containing protein [Chloroflexota bacterium]
MARPFFSALLLAGLLVVTLWGIVVMVRNSLAVMERNQIAAATDTARDQMAAQPGDGMAQVASASGRIAFAQQGRIAVARADGTMPTFLTRGPGDHTPVWSPDGTRIAFVTAGVAERTGIYVVTIETGEERRVAPAAAVYSRPTWSPDSRRLVFRDPAKERAGIYVANADGTGITQIFKGNANTPTWSPDGRWIAFTFNQRPTTGGLYLTDPDGADPKVLLPGVFSEVSWSPDSSLLAVRGVSWPAGEPAVVRGIQEAEQVLVVERTSGKATVLSTEAGGGAWAPAWSPDGTAIALPVGKVGAQQLVVVPVAGGSPRTLAQGAHFIQPVWSPDGKELAVSVPAGPNSDALVLAVRADGSGTRKFAPGELPAWAK